MNKWVYFIWFCLSGNILFSQSTVWEKIEGSKFANFDPMNAVTDAQGNTYVVGRYETGLEFFKEVNGKTVYADTTLPYGTHPFIQKFSPTGKLICSAFLPGIEAQHIVLLADHRIAVSGFMNDYREKNYERDRGQGVFALFLDTTLKTQAYRVYPSFYNSTPFGMTCDAQNGLIIAASSFTKPDPEMGLKDEFSLRLIHTDATGATLFDSTYLRPAWFLKSNFDASTFDGLALAKGAAGSFWLCGEVSGRDSTYRNTNPMALIQFDQEFYSMTTQVFTHREKFSYKIGAYVNDLVASEKYVFVVGQDLHVEPESFVFLFNTKGDTLYKKGFNGDYGDTPVVAQIDETNWAVLNVSETDEFVISFFNLQGFVKEKRYKTQKYCQPRALIVHNKQLIAVGRVTVGEIRKIWMSKINLD